MYRFLQDESGATAIEYALIAIFLSMAILVAAAAVGTNLVPIFQAVNSGLAP